MNRQALVRLINAKKSCLCIGLDPDVSKIPAPLNRNIEGIYTFLTNIIDATRDFCVAYKPNTAFYEILGVEGWELFQKIVKYIGNDHFIIADAKRGDIGNTSYQYASTFFETYRADAITVVPYMGHDSVRPFLDFPDKWTILLGLTSNEGSQDFQHLLMSNRKPLYEEVLRKSSNWGNKDNLMYVIGATQAQFLKEIRLLLPDYFFLVPGIGAQGGSISEVLSNGMNNEVGLLINVSRGILYAGDSITNYTQQAEKRALAYQVEMAGFIV